MLKVRSVGAHSWDHGHHRNIYMASLALSSARSLNSRERDVDFSQDTGMEYDHVVAV